MTLYDLINATTICGSFVEIRVFDENDNQLEAEWFESVDDLSCEDIDKYEDMKIRYIFSESFVRYYPNSTKNCSMLVIELSKESEE